MHDRPGWRPPGAARAVVAAVLVAVVAAGAAASTARADDEVSLQGTNTVGRVYERAQWGLMSYRLVNPTDRAISGEVRVRWPKGEGVASGVDVVVPPRSRLTGDVPVYSAELSRPRRGQGPEVTLDLVRAEGEAGLIATGKGIIPVDRSRVHIGVLGAERGSGHERVIAALAELGELDGKPRPVGGRATIDSLVALLAYESLVWAGDRLDPTAAEAAALRQWLADGGRLWVMLDAVDPAAVQRVLGPVWRVAVLDRGVVATGAVHAAGAAAGDDGDNAEVAAVRTLAPTMRVIAEADGFPAAMTAEVGAGRLLVTTVGPEGWIEADGSPRGPLALLDGLLEAERRPRAILVAAGGAGEPGVAELSAEMAVGMVGHRVLSRGWAVAVLGGLVVALLVAAGVMAARGVLGWFVAVAVGASLLAGGGLVAMGAVHRTATPKTSAVVQVARGGGATGLASVDAVEAQYRPSSDDDGSVIRLGDGLPGEQTLDRLPPTARVVWNGDGGAELRGMPPRPGATRVVHSKAVRRVAVAPTVTLTLDEAGVVGEVAGVDRSAYSAPSVVGPWRKTPADVSAEGALRLAAGPGGRADGWQRSREAVARDRLLSAVLQEQPPHRAGLFACWVGEQRTAGEDGAVVKSQTLVLAAVRWQRPAAGTTVRVPDAVLDRTNFTHRAAFMAGNAIIPTTHRWDASLVGPKTILAAFHPPASLLPLAPVAATLTLDIDTGPLQFEVVTLKGEKFQVLGEVSRTRGSRTFTLGPDLLPRAWSRSGLVFGVRPKLGRGRLSEDAVTATWAIRDMAVDVTATVPAADPDATPDAP